jgi:hypothetical protein
MDFLNGGRKQILLDIALNVDLESEHHLHVGRVVDAAENVDVGRSDDVPNQEVIAELRVQIRVVQQQPEPRQDRHDDGLAAMH